VGQHLSYQTISGASTAIVGRNPGHKSSEATAVYARLNLDPVRASVEKATAAMLAMKNDQVSSLIIPNVAPIAPEPATSNDRKYL